MVEALVAMVLQNVFSTMYLEAEQEVTRVVGVTKQIQNLTTTLQSIQALLLDAEKRQVTQQVVKLWLEKLKDVSYQIDDVLDDWSTSILKSQIDGTQNNIPSSPCFCFNRIALRRDIAVKINGLNSILNLIAREKDSYNLNSVTTTAGEEIEQRRPITKTTSFVNVCQVFGRTQDMHIVVSKLLLDCSEDEMGFYMMISVVGMGGVGKTTFAQLVYNDDSVKSHFEIRIWICVSDPFDEIRVAREIVKAVEGSDPSIIDCEDLPRRVHESIAGKKFLLVLDDVWTEDFKKWEPLQHCLSNGAKGSRILVTTRNERVAKMMGSTYTHQLEELSKEVCRSLFGQIAFWGRSKEDREKFEEISWMIADKCKGLPLAVKTLGSLMRHKNTKQDWQNVLDSEMWELEEVERGLFPPLLLSYFDLPSKLKRCFSFCAIFPKDRVIETDKLIKLWAAEGYLSSGQTNTEMEVTGRQYFEHLAMRSLFQNFGRNRDDGSIVSCKMHDIVHDFALYLTRNEIFIVKDDGEEPSVDLYRRKGRHSTLLLAGQDPIPSSIYDTKNLRTLLAPNVTSKIANSLPDIFKHLTYLRALDLSSNSLKELPEDVGRLIHLRYLNLSFNKFEKLPEALCDLCNLQTLNLSYCRSLVQLPTAMARLINLRHLETEFTLVSSLPKGMGRLSYLRTLSEFVVGVGHDRDTCKLGDLEILNNLRGNLTLKGLGNVTVAGEAEKANLKGKKHLTGLVLDFFSGKAEGSIMNNVLEALQPHPNLEFLEIQYYRGASFSNWMMMLPRLRKLQLSLCRNCVRLPPLGKLPSLESLKIRDMDSLQKVGVELLGLENDGKDSINIEGRAEGSGIVAFPKLKELILYRMKEWVEWDMIITGRESENTRIMPCLCSLTIKFCPKLKVMPRHLQTIPLQELEITGCPILKQRCQKAIGEDWSKISHISNIRMDD